MSENGNEFVDLTSNAPVNEIPVAEEIKTVVEEVAAPVVPAAGSTAQLKADPKAQAKAEAAQAAAKAKEAKKQAEAAEKQARKEAQKQEKIQAKNEAKKQKKLDKVAKEQEKIDQCPKEYRPVSTSRFFWTTILCGIPIIGLLFTLIFSFAPRNRNIKNFARSILAFYIIAVVLALIGMVVAMIFGGESFAEIMQAVGSFFEEITYSFSFG